MRDNEIIDIPDSPDSELSRIQRLVLRFIAILTTLPGVLIVIALLFFLINDGNFRASFLSFQDAPVTVTITIFYLTSAAVSSIAGGVLLLFLKRWGWFFSSLFYVIFLSMNTAIIIGYAEAPGNMIIWPFLLFVGLVLLLWLMNRRSITSYFLVSRGEQIVLLLSFPLFTFLQLVLR